MIIKPSANLHYPPGVVNGPSKTMGIAKFSSKFMVYSKLGMLLKY